MSLSGSLPVLRKPWRRVLSLGVWCLIILFLLPRSTIQISDRWQAIAYEISADQFDYIAWEVGAIGAKADQLLFGMHPFMDEAARSQFVRDYMADLARARGLDAEIARLYSDPTIADAARQSEAQRAERDALRANLATRQTTAEAILEGQVATILTEAGFGLGGQLFPPMAMRFSAVPNLLVTSPRDAIRMEISLNINPLPVDAVAALETRLDERYDVSSLIVPLGGIALYPAMILETSSIPFAAETFAHEWLHHYLYFFPLGIYYITGGDGFASEARIINETTADLFGKEVSRLVLARYYPELLPPEPAPVSRAAPVVVVPDPNAFNFGAEMNETRVTVDELLAAGNVEEAEAYMEQRRLFFYENGYRLRRLNQAYFAFYGGYQGGAVPGVGGEDPIGPAVRQLRQQSETLYEFVYRMRGVTTRAQLVDLAEAG